MIICVPTVWQKLTGNIFQNLFMHKIFFLLTLLLWPFTLKSQTLPDSLTQEKMRIECDSFLARMPQGLQHRQSEAVKTAIKGNNRALEDIRNGRNSPPVLPEEEQADYNTPTLCLYRPKTEDDTPRPILLYLHGGGWAFGSINSCARFCAAVARTSGCYVAALNYRLAPEHPFPAPLQDCIEAFRYLQSHAAEWGGDSTRISIGGDSAGGNLALATGLSIPDVYSLIPIYPVTKIYTAPSASWNRYATGYGCDAELLESFNTAYAGTEYQHPLASVALAADSQLVQLPPMLLISAGRDILYDQGKEWVERIQSLNKKIDHLVFPTATHLFITVPGQPTAFDRAVQSVSAYLRQ